MRKIDTEEKAILEAFEAGTLKSVKNRSRELARNRKVAAATIRMKKSNDREEKHITPFLEV